MVNSAVKLEYPLTTVTTDHEVRKTRSNICPRCSGQMSAGYYEPECIICGYTDYSKTPVINDRSRKNVVNSATLSILRYGGDSPALYDILAHVELVRVRNRAVYSVKCPFCGEMMERSSLSGKRPEAREERYKCPGGHRISLIPGRNGQLSWK